MGLFKFGEKKMFEKDKTLILNNTKFADSLSKYAGIDVKTANTIGNISDKIKYFTPSSKSEVVTIDQKIEHKLSDLKIELSANFINEQKLNICIKDITNLIADRDYESRKK